MLLLGLASCGGHRLYGASALNYPDGVELRQALPRPVEVGEGQLAIKYLRAGGLLLRWRGEQILTAPFFSNYPLLTLRAQRVVTDEQAVHKGLSDPHLNLHLTSAILVGHSHYDHIADLPLIARRYAPYSALYVNQSGAYMLQAYPELAARTRVLEAATGWTYLSPHVRLFGHTVHWAEGDVGKEWQGEWSRRRVIEQREGRAFAFLIDFLEPGPEQRVAFRVHYQDAASVPPLGYLPSPQFGPGGDTRDVDLAILCMPGREALPAQADRYPSGVLANTRAHHALVIHYESFFRPVQSGGEWSSVRLLPNLSEHAATQFLTAIDRAVLQPRPGPCAPPYGMQGLCSRAYTVPLPGEWVVFDTEPSRVVAQRPSAVD
jgi:hypothetical protein